MRHIELWQHTNQSRRGMASQDEYEVNSDFSDSDYDSDDNSVDNPVDDPIDNSTNNDDDAAILSVNLVFHIPGPYTTTWIHSIRRPWSKDMIEHSKFNITDAALLAFIVDVAMKIYIADDIGYPVSYITDDSELVWVILEQVTRSIYTRVRDFGWHPRSDVAAVERVYLAVTRDLYKIRERFSIAFLQGIQDPATKTAIARQIAVHRSFADWNQRVGLVFRWVYGEWASSVLEEKEMMAKSKDGSSPHPAPTPRPAITIRQWVFEQN